MSRRKQARPRSLKRDDLQPADYEDESTQDTLLLLDGMPRLHCSSPKPLFEATNMLSDDQASLDEDYAPQQHTCGNCCLQFEDIDEFLEHLNQDCMTGGSSAGCGSASEGSVVSLSPGGSSGGDPDADLSYTVGVTENTPYGCQFCDKAFPRLSYLKRHEQIHSDQMPFRCDYCQRLFKHKRSRDRHVKLHTGDRKYRCAQCESAFSRSDHLKIHMKTHDNGKPYQCAVCNRGYNTAAALSSHMQNHKRASEQLQQPDQAAAGFRGGAQEQKDDSSESPEPAKPSVCALCPQVCSSPSALGEHVLQSHASFSPLPQSPPRSKCGRCLDELSSPNSLCHHKKAPNDNESEKLLSNATSEASAKKPSDRFSPGMKLTCGFCSKSDFATFESLQLHVQVLHLPTGGAGDPTAASIRSLQALLHNKRPPLQQSVQTDNHLGYAGLEIDSGYAARQMLQKHLSLGDGLMLKRSSDIYCSQCNVCFGSSASLLEHVRMVHENTSPLSSSPISPQSSKRSLANSRLRPNGTKHLKTSVLSAHSMVFNGNASSHYRRQDPGGGQSNISVPNASSSQSPNPSNSNAATLLCSQCNAGFPDFESFRTHLKSHLDAAAASSNATAPQSAVALQRFACPECSAEFGSEALLDSHVTGHFLAATTEYGCQSCMKLFHKPDELQKHLMDIHAHHLYRCALCKQIFDSKVSIQVHFAVKHSNECRSLKCTSCSAYFRTEQEFQVHVKVSHLASPTSGKNFPQTFRCLFCDQLFPNEVQLRYHAATHKRQFSCSACGDAFHVEFLLDRHIQEVHQQAGSPPLSLSRQLQGTSRQQNLASPTSCVGADVAQNLSTKKSQNGGQARGDHNQHSDAASVLPQPASSPTAPSMASATSPRCDICDLPFPSESGLTSHRRQAHHIRSGGKEHAGGKHGAASAPNPASGSAVSLFCAYCSESCKSRSELENHMKAHTATPSKHKCNICDEMCPSATTLAEHKLTHCKVVSGSTCIVCRVQLQNEDQFLSHIQQHSTNVTSNSSSSNNNNNSSNTASLPVPCVVCRQTLVVDVEVRMHARFHLKNAQFEPSAAPCCVCSRTFDLSNLIIRGSKPSDSAVLPHTYMCKDCFHSKKDDAGNVCMRCGECGVKFESQGDLELHRKTVHHQGDESRTYQCIKCQMSFESEADIQTHVNCHVMHEGTNHECRLCHEVLDTPSKLQCHLIEHTFEGSSHFACYLCATVFTGSHLLQRHMLEHGLDARPYDCTECRQKFFFRAELENHAFLHLAAHHGGRTPGAGTKVNSDAQGHFYECNKCPRVFGNSHDLQKHQRSHFRQEDSFKQDPDRNLVSCSNCGVDFPSMDELRSHMILVHPLSHLRETFLNDKGNLYEMLQDGYPPDVNRLCEEMNSKSQDRLRDEREKKSFECPDCGKKFTRKENRKLHMKSHHQQLSPKSFSCPDCGKSFSKRSHFKEHVRTHNSTSTTTPPSDSCDEPLPSAHPMESHKKDDPDLLEVDSTCIVCQKTFDKDTELQDHLDKEHQVHVLELDDDQAPEDEKETPSKETNNNSVPSSPVTSIDEGAKISDSEGKRDSTDTSATELEEVVCSDEFKGPEERTSLPAEVAA